ncbi:MAG: hypothetical protein R2851_13555 [Caldilineaceae bacterium]
MPCSRPTAAIWTRSTLTAGGVAITAGPHHRRRLADNLPRILPGHLAARIDTGAWTVPPVFQALLAWSGMDHAEAYRVFNMGMGMAVIPAASTWPRPEPRCRMPCRWALITRCGDAAQVELA